MNKFSLFNTLLLLLFTATNIFSQDLEKLVKDIPNPRVSNGSWVYQDFNILGSKEAEINQAIAQLERATTAEIAVVILTTIGDNIPKECATKLFNHWGIGKKDKNNGVLVLHILDQKRVEIETGYGMEGILSDVKCKWVIDSITIPYFKAGNFSGGHAATIDALIRGIEQPDITKENLLSGYIYYPLELELSMEDSIAKYTDIFDDNKEKYKSSFDILLDKIVMYLILGCIAIAGIIGLFTWVRNKSIKDPKKKYDFLNKALLRNINLSAFSISAALAVFLLANVGFVAVIIQGIVSVFGFIIVGSGLIDWLGLDRKKSELRKASRICKKCNQKMSIHRENTEDQFLDEVQLVEEKIKSKDYDVWECGCGEIRIDDYEGKTVATKCPECTKPTYYVTKHQKLKSPTYSSSGLEKYWYACGFCGHKHEKEVSIPKLTPPSSSSSSGSSSSSSFGGGSSGGGGAGGSY